MSGAGVEERDVSCMLARIGQMLRTECQTFGGQICLTASVHKLASRLCHRSAGQDHLGQSLDLDLDGHDVINRLGTAVDEMLV